MPKLLISILSTLLLTSAVSQTRTASLYLQADYNKTIYDRTIGNNPWGIGAGLQLFLNNSRKLKPTFELTAATYLENDKVLRLDQNDQPIDDVGSMVNLLAGISYHPANRLYISMMTGPSFVSGQTCLAIKPGAGFYFSERQRWSGKISFTNVFNRDGTSGKDFGSHQSIDLHEIVLTEMIKETDHLKTLILPFRLCVFLGAFAGNHRPKDFSSISMSIVMKLF